MKRLAVVTATRAEYGLLTPLIRKVQEDCELELDLIVTGAHLAEKQGYTIQEIIEDGFPITHRIPILEEGNTPYDISVTMANAIKGFAQCFRDDRPDMVVVLGDRTEMLGVAGAAMNERIPIAHIHGGEITEGAVDDCVRHCLTKMSYLHFTASESYRRRVIQLGEEPGRVFYVGGLGTENVLNTPLLEESRIRRDVGIPNEMPYTVVTFHPVTLESASAEGQIEELCKAMRSEKEYFYLLTKANADAGGAAINYILEKFANTEQNVKLVDSLGMVRYLSAVKYASFVLGNSSSGILEAPVLGVPTVNIGDRQKGRLMAETVVNCDAECGDIRAAIKKAAQIFHKPTLLYGSGNTSAEIIRIVKRFLCEHGIDIKKKFYDMENIQ